MGQGTESCGGYEADFNPYSEGLADHIWTQRNGSTIHVKDMTVSHLKAARRFVETKAEQANFSSDADEWLSWSEVFRNELLSRTQASSKTPTHAVRGKKVTMVCHCGSEYEARAGDIARGWGLSCSKHCAAVRREFRKPAATRKQAEKVKCV